MVSFTHVIKSPLYFDVLSRQTHIHHTGRFYFFQISFSIGMLFDSGARRCMNVLN